MYRALPRHLHFEPFRHGIDALCPDAVRATGKFITALAAFAAGMRTAGQNPPSTPGKTGVLTDVHRYCHGHHRGMEMEPSTCGSSPQCPRAVARARCSSTGICSSTSLTQWCNARSSVPPIYMPGFFRTASSPLSWLRSSAPYFPAAILSGDTVFSSDESETLDIILV